MNPVEHEKYTYDKPTTELDRPDRSIVQALKTLGDNINLLRETIYEAESKLERVLAPSPDKDPEQPSVTATPFSSPVGGEIWDLAHQVKNAKEWLVSLLERVDI